jgi:predicted 3-demethylubiquinone-9 3-methyltransferase (glyoxalase superfamily)
MSSRSRRRLSFDDDKGEAMKQKITTFLTFDGRAGEAAEFYTSVFPGARVTSERRFPAGAPGPEGELMTATIELYGQELALLNGGPSFTFAEGISLFVDCEDQAEVDELWEKLTADGGRESMCGWLVDRFGVSWQIVPRRLSELLGDEDPGRAQRALEAMLKMQKIDVAELERLADDDLEERGEATPALHLAAVRVAEALIHLAVADAPLHAGLLGAAEDHRAHRFRRHRVERGRIGEDLARRLGRRMGAAERVALERRHVLGPVPLAGRPDGHRDRDLRLAGRGVGVAARIHGLPGTAAGGDEDDDRERREPHASTSPRAASTSSSKSGTSPGS